MDKNMIKIDDLVRQRLTGAEEQERTGAWLNMRDLLDEKMPSRKPLAVFPWKKLMTAVTGVTLLAMLGAGGYRLYSNRTELSMLNSMTHEEPVNGQLINATTNSISKPVNSPKDKQGIAEDKITIVNKKNSAALGNDLSLNKDMHQQNITEKSAPLTIHKNNQDKPNNSTNQHSKTNNKKEEVFTSNTTTKANKQSIVALTNKEEKVDDDRVMQPSLIASNTHANTKQHNNKNVFNASTNNRTQQQVTKQVKVELNTKNTEAKVNSVLNSSSQPLVKDNTATVKQVVKRDTFNSITLLQRVELNPLTRKAKFVNDTVAMGKMAVEHVQTLPVKEEQQLALANTKRITSTATIAPAATMVNVSSSSILAENSLLVPLSTMKVKAHKTQAWDARSFNDVVRDVQYNLSLVRFYPGIIFGINNNMFGTNNINGLHIGLTGNFTFGEHWNMMAELKYMHRINQGTNLQDNYAKVTDSAVNSNGQKTYLQSNVEHFFKFSTMQSLELPISVRYAFNRFNLFAGVNMAYNFAVNAEEVDRTFDTTIVVSGALGLALGKEPQVKITDFGPRFSLGYLLGVGYQLSPSVQLDFRATQNLWDNATSSGGLLVSKQLYRMPSLQLSLSYRFNQRARIPKAR